MNIVSISIAMALCISVNVVAMEQSKRQKQTNAAEKSLCWMCKQENVEGQSADYTMQSIPVGSDGRVFFGYPSGAPYTVRLHKSCCDPVKSFINQCCLNQIKKGNIQSTEQSHAQNTMLYVLYALTKINNKTVQTYITENGNNVPFSVVQILATGTYTTLSFATKLQ